MGQQRVNVVTAPPSDAEEMERLATLGMNAAGMAHELSNALMSVIQNIELIQTEINRLRPHLTAFFAVDDLDGFINETMDGSHRITRVLEDLNFYSGWREDKSTMAPLTVSNEKEDKPGPRHACPRRRILIVDDEAPILRASARTLGAAHDVITCRHGVEALELLQVDDRFDLILCDVLMPGMGGAELHAALATRQPALAARMIFMTGGPYMAKAVEFVRSMQHRCVEKPLNAAQLRRLVRVHAGKPAG